jgi:hypothetical protein
MGKPFIVGVGGFTSRVGKTSLMCELLRAFPGWEAIKTTRGHYRSCGKDADACCVSHLLGAEPLIRSGRSATYEFGKDTGRYWDAGAVNVHWLIATGAQIEKGIHQTLERVRSEGVFVEGNTFSQFVSTDYFVMVKHAGSEEIKRSAKAALAKASAVFVFDPAQTVDETSSRRLSINGGDNSYQVFSASTLPDLISQLRLAVNNQFA